MSQLMEFIAVTPAVVPSNGVPIHYVLILQMVPPVFLEDLRQAMTGLNIYYSCKSLHAGDL